MGDAGRSTTHAQLDRINLSNSHGRRRAELHEQAWGTFTEFLLRLEEWLSELENGTAPTTLIGSVTPPGRSIDPATTSEDIPRARSFYSAVNDSPTTEEGPSNPPAPLEPPPDFSTRRFEIALQENLIQELQRARALPGQTAQQARERQDRAFDLYRRGTRALEGLRNLQERLGEIQREIRRLASPAPPERPTTTQQPPDDDNDTAHCFFWIIREEEEGGIVITHPHNLPRPCTISGAFTTRTTPSRKFPER